MRIGLNMLFVAPGVAGGRVYCEGLLRGLAAVDREHEFWCYTRRDVSLPPVPTERFHQVTAPVQAGSLVWRTLWEFMALPRAARKDGIQLLHGLGNVSPAGRGCPFVLTIHDLIYRAFPQSLPFGHRCFLHAVQPAVARRADRILVPSRHSLDDVVRQLGVREERVRVVPYGPGNDFAEVSNRARVDAVLGRYGVRRPYIVSVARAYPHKNLAGLLRAFGRLRERGRTDVQLVLIGDRYRMGRRLLGLAETLGLEQVILTGFVSHEDLNALYSGAAVFAFPSLAEGFGLPVLEAMACGTPVVASSASAVPEAVGDAGLLADATDPEAFAVALGRVLDDAGIQAELRQKGRLRVRQFSWEEAALQTLAVYREVL